MHLHAHQSAKPADEIPFEQRPSCTMREACSATGLSRNTLYERIAAGELIATKVGRRRLVNVQSLLALVGADRGQKDGPRKQNT